MRIDSDSAFGHADIGAQVEISYALVCVLVFLCDTVPVDQKLHLDPVRICPAKETQHPSMVCNQLLAQLVRAGQKSRLKFSSKKCVNIAALVIHCFRLRIEH